MRIAVALAGTAITLFASAGSAAAQETTCEQQGLIPRYEVKNQKFSYSYDNFDHGSEWMVSGKGPGTLVLARTVESSNSFSVSLDVPVQVLTASLGFDVTESVSYTASYEFDMPAEPRDNTWFVEAGTRDEVYVFEVQKLCGFEPEGEPEKGLAEKTGHLIYHWWGEPPGTPRN